MSFLITGYGRSGTKWLSNILDSDPKWTVLHEPRGSSDLAKSFEAKKDMPTPFLENPWYGEVNSYLRFCVQASYLNNIDTGIIFRSPYSILVSALNKNYASSSDSGQIEIAAHNYIDDIIASYQYFNNVLTVYPGTKRIDFVELTINFDYFENVLGWLGISNIQTNLYNQPLNSTYKRWEKFSDLSTTIKQYAIRKFGTVW